MRRALVYSELVTASHPRLFGIAHLITLLPDGKVRVAGGEAARDIDGLQVRPRGLIDA
jgi:hypothetical protein